MYQDALPRRTSLGLELSARTFDVLSVVPGGTAAAAGLLAGDRLILIDDLPAPDASKRVRRVGDRVTFTVERGGERLVLEGREVEAPIERLSNADVRLGHVTLPDGVRLRTIRTMPRGESAPYVTVMLLPGLGHASCELGADADDPRRRLIEELGALGVSTFRVERSGTGDSEGPPSAETDLFTEIAGYRAALDALAADPTVRRVVLFGQSVGGMIAPLVGPDLPLIVFGTSSRRWVDCIVRGTRIQRRLADPRASDDEVDAHVEAWEEMHVLVCREGLTPDDVFERHPGLRTLAGSACRDRALFGRDVAFFQQLERADLEALWRTVSGPVLVLSGAFDWICEPADGRRIAEIAPAATFVELPAIGHDLRAHASLEQSFRAAREGRWDGSVVRSMRDFLVGEKG